jgi:glycosyltransferase involved in cell wall biosynthesis
VYIELLPWVPYSIERGLMRAAGRQRYSIEMDDAWFHRYDSHRSPIVRFVLGNKIDKLMRDAEFVVAGNQYIADRATLAGAKQVDVIPTVVRMEKYAAAATAKETSAPVTIGWIGTPATTKFLLHIESVIRELTRDKVAEFVAIGADANQLKGLPIKTIPWSDAEESAQLHAFDIGIMPLTDSMFERGKCGYKLIQYMACGLPVVGSPVGVNSAIVDHGNSGFLAGTQEEWSRYLRTLCADKALREQQGRAGLARATELYSLDAATPKLVSIFTKALRSK